jgi:hypothetical protein
LITAPKHVQASDSSSVQHVEAAATTAAEEEVTLATREGGLRTSGSAGTSTTLVGCLGAGATFLEAAGATFLEAAGGAPLAELDLVGTFLLRIDGLYYTAQHSACMNVSYRAFMVSFNERQR